MNDLEWLQLFVLTQFLVLLGFMVYGSFFEWAVHKYVLHRYFPGIGYAFKNHQLKHHIQYKGDSTYEVQEKPSPEDSGAFSPLDYLLLLVVHLPLFFLFDFVTGINISVGGAFGVLLYTFLFDYLHYRFHFPQDRWIEKFRWFQNLKEHHRLHHKRQNRNYNVVFPLADWVLRTKIRVHPPSGIHRRVYTWKGGDIP